MKRWILWVLFLVLLCSASGLVQAETEQIILPEELQQRMDESLYINLFDLRSEEAYQAGHLPLAASFPLDTLRQEMQRILDNGYSYMSAEIIVYGETEDQGTEAVDILQELGFTNVKRLKSLEAWTGEMLSREDEYLLLGNLETQDIYGNPVDTSLLEGHRVTMVNVWATYCGPCIQEMADLGKLARETEELQVLGLLSDAMDASFSPSDTIVAKARKIAESTGADYPHLLPSRHMYRKIISAIDAVPTTFFVNEQGKMVGQVYIGSRDYDAWKQIVEDLLRKLETN